MQLDNKRIYERMVGNLLPWKATSVRKNKKARFDPTTSTPFLSGEFIAVRDEPDSWIFLAKLKLLALFQLSCSTLELGQTIELG